MQFDEIFEALTDKTPLNWQRRLYETFIQGDIPTVCDLPTGIGKTSVIPIWLIALAHQIDNIESEITIPRRLVYVVDRRTVVDQATLIAEQIRLRLSKPYDINWQAHKDALQWVSEKLITASVSKEPVIAISSLRGELADNKEWKRDPTKPAIIIGTIDMIGSKLLFNGYGDGPYSRTHHAGLIGQDSFIIHDEAHLTPAFSKLLRRLADIQKRSDTLMPIKVMDLSATIQEKSNSIFRLEESDLVDVFVKERMNAIKRLHLNLVSGDTSDKKSEVQDKIMERILELSLRYKEGQYKVIIYVESPNDAESIFRRLQLEVGNNRVELLTGTIRGYERDMLIQKPLFQCFLSPASSVQSTIYLISTSAGEVGIDADADHMVCDLTSFDSLIQRFGRVNRRGGQGRTARIDIVTSRLEKERKPKLFKNSDAIQTTFSIIMDWTSQGNEGIDVCPTNLVALLNKMSSEQRDRAFSRKPSPLRLSNIEIMLDIWSLTSISERMPYFPEVEAFLHGLDDEPSETYVLWRKEVTLLANSSIDKEVLNEWFEVCPILARERLHDRTSRIKDKLKLLLIERRKKDKDQNLDFPVLLLDERGGVILKEESNNPWYFLSEIISNDFDLEYLTVVLPIEAGGLGDGGELDPRSRDSFDVADIVSGEGVKRLRLIEMRNEEGKVYQDPLISHSGASSSLDGLKEIYRMTLNDPEENEEAEIYLILLGQTTQLAEMSRIPQSLDFHLRYTAREMQLICDKLNLKNDLKDALVMAAEHHDLGKNRPLWQWYANNDDYASPVAKSEYYRKGWELGGYRHEFGSLLVAETDYRIRNHPKNDLILHLIASHHKWARPHFENDAVDNTFPTTRNEAALAETVRRFSRLQLRLGRWGLAYLESLLRCADNAASLAVEIGRKEQRQEVSS